MKMVNINTGKEVQPEVWGTMSYASGKLQDMINGFANSGERVVRLVVGADEYVSMASARGAVHQAIKSTGKGWRLKVKQAHGNLFLVDELL